MLPIPFYEYLPNVYRDAKEPAAVALGDKMDELLKDWRKDVVAFGNLYDPERCPSVFLIPLGKQLQAGILSGDSERVKRRKIKSAIETNKLRSTWKFSTKLKIDAIVGNDSKIIQVVGADDWIIVGENNFPDSYYWSVIGGGSVDDNYGIRLVGTAGAEVIKGVVLIDIDDSTLSSDEVESVKLNIQDSVPVYFIVKLGYVSGGSFVPYANSQIG